MNITIVCDVLGEANNGTTLAALNLINAMKARGHNVRVICSDKSRKGQEGFYIVPTLYLGAIINHYLKKNGVALSRPVTKTVTAAIEGADVVHFMTPFRLSRKAAKLARRNRIPVTAGFHCQAENFTSHIFMKDSKIANRLFYHIVWSAAYKNCTRIHYPTQFIRDTFEQTIHRETPGVVISNGVNTSFHPETVERDPKYGDKILVHFTGRLSKEKTHKVLIDAVNLSRYRDQIQLIFAGIGPQKEKLEKRGRKLPNPPEFNFYSREDLVKQLNMSDLYVHPAEVEIEAISCLEAIACGLVPVIANSPRSATRYFALDERNLFRNQDPQDLADRIDYWIEHPEEKRTLSERYKGFVEQHEFEHCMDRMEQMFIDAVKERANGI